MGMYWDAHMTIEPCLQGTPMLSAADVTDPQHARFVSALWALRRRLAPLMQPHQFDSVRDLTWLGAGGGEPAWGGPSTP